MSTKTIDLKGTYYSEAKNTLLNCINSAIIYFSSNEKKKESEFIRKPT